MDFHQLLKLIFIDSSFPVDGHFAIQDFASEEFEFLSEMDNCYII